MCPKRHVLGESIHGFRLSRYLQDRICYLGQSQVYEECRESLGEFLGVDVCTKQIERICHCYGGLLDESAMDEDELLRSEADEVVYAMADGSMVLTRESGWKEMKLGRLFAAVSHQETDTKRGYIKESIYTAHLGHYSDFLSKWSKEIPSGGRLVFLADGAKWLWDWVAKNHPNATQILDYYHCIEYLYHFSDAYFAKKDKRAIWIKKQEKRLFKDQVDKVIEDIQNLPIKKAADSATKRKILTYYNNNQERMLYGRYQENGLLIGSGPIEAAHRNVIQQRLKLAGQRWTKPGAQYIANLRVCRKSQRWNRIVELTDFKKIAA